MSDKQSVGDNKVTHFEDGGNLSSGGEKLSIDAENLPRYDDVETNEIMRKVDWRLLPPLTVLYVLSFMDRSNIGNTKVAGMNVDLGLTGPQFNMDTQACIKSARSDQLAFVDQISVDIPMPEMDAANSSLRQFVCACYDLKTGLCWAKHLYNWQKFLKDKIPSSA